MCNRRGISPWRSLLIYMRCGKKLCMICTIRDFTLSLLLKLKIDLLYGKRIGIPYQKK